MKNRKSYLYLIPAVLLSATVQAQTVGETAVAKELPLVGLGAGITIFRGDVGRDAGVGLTSTTRPIFNFYVEQRFHNWYGIELNGAYGQLANAERSILLNRNFESPLMQFGVNGILYFDNDAWIKRNAPFTPYLAVGLGYSLFDPHADLLDVNNNPYFYWSDGSIRNQPDLPANQFSSILLQRDYSYETQLKDSTTNYSRGSLAVPLALGFRFRFSQRTGADLRLGYTLMMSDYVDNVKASGNDAYITTGVHLWYKFGVREKDTGPSMSEILNADFDGDGVTDANDKCEGTPKGVKVDHNGCPEDSDGDGIADYLDEEPNSKKGAIVDGKGNTIDFAKIERQQYDDSIRGIHRERFEQNPSRQTLEENNPTTTTTTTTTNAASKIPIEFQPADKDKNGLITADEINHAIDDFFDGTGDWTVEKINRLIDYFFEQ